MRCIYRSLLSTLCFFMVTAFWSTTVHAQTLAWVKRAGGANLDSGWSIAALPDGSTLVTGTFQSSITFGSGETNETTLTGAGNFDIFVAKYNPDGTLAWAKRAGGSSYDNGTSLAALPDGTSFVTGIFSSSATFGPGESGETSLTSAGNYEIFVARYNPDGSLAWAKRAGGIASEECRAITVMSDGTSYITGFFQQTATFGPGETNATDLTSAGGDDIFVAKYSPDGTLAWAKRAGGIDCDAGYGISVLWNGDALLTGSFADSATFGPGDAYQTILTSAGLSDIFVAKYNPDGTIAWAKQAGGYDYDYGISIVVLPDGKSLVACEFLSSATFGPGEANETVLNSSGDYDIALAKYDLTGTLLWAQRAGGTADDQVKGIAALADDAFLIAGYYEGSITFGYVEPNETTLSSVGDADIFLSQYNPEGSLAWAKRVGGGASYDDSYGIAALSDGSAWVTGRFFDVATFAEGECNETALTATGRCDVYVAKYVPSLAHYTFDTGTEYWQYSSTVPPFAPPQSSSSSGHLGLNANGSALSFGFWFSPQCQVENGKLYRSKWTVASDASTADATVQFRLRINQIGTLAGWDRVVNSFLAQAPSTANPKTYDLFFNANVNGPTDNSVTFSFDMLSFDLSDDTNSFVYLDELIVDKVSTTSQGVIQAYDFTTSSESWEHPTGPVIPYDEATSAAEQGRLALSPNGSANCFSFWYSPDIEIAANTIYRVVWEAETSVASADDAVQCRLRANQKGAWAAWNRTINSAQQSAPSLGNPKIYSLILSPTVTGSSDNMLMLSFDLMSFDPSDDTNSWLYLNSAVLQEITLIP